jgi:hypothetical protein
MEASGILIASNSFRFRKSGESGNPSARAIASLSLRESVCLPQSNLYNPLISIRRTAVPFALLRDRFCVFEFC